VNASVPDEKDRVPLAFCSLCPDLGVVPFDNPLNGRKADAGDLFLVVAALGRLEDLCGTLFQR
jgi:hypothetical protein